MNRRAVTRFVGWLESTGLATVGRSDRDGRVVLVHGVRFELSSARLCRTRLGGSGESTDVEPFLSGTVWVQFISCSGLTSPDWG